MNQSEFFLMPPNISCALKTSTPISFKNDENTIERRLVKTLRVRKLHPPPPPPLTSTSSFAAYQHVKTNHSTLELKGLKDLKAQIKKVNENSRRIQARFENVFAKLERLL